MRRLKGIIYVLVICLWGGLAIYSFIKVENPFITILFGLCFALYLIAGILELYTRHQKKVIKRLKEERQGTRDLVKEYLKSHPEERDPTNPTKIRDEV